MTTKLLKLQPTIDVTDILAQFDQKVKVGKEKFGIVMVGGGAKGRWQAGFNYRLAELGLLQRAQVFVGTSVGGLNSLITARYINEPDKILEVWNDINANNKIYNGTLPQGWLGLSKFILSFQFLRSRNLLTVEPLISIVAKHFGSTMKAKDLPVETYTCTADIFEGRQVVMGGDAYIKDMALSTCAIPVAFPMYNDRYIDGGVFDNEPFDVATQKGATKILGLFCEPEKTPSEPKLSNMLDIALRCFNIIYASNELKMWNAVKAKQDFAKATGGEQIEFDLYYPQKSTGSVLNFANVEVMQQGYDDACKYVTREKLTQFLLS